MYSTRLQREISAAEILHIALHSPLENNDKDIVTWTKKFKTIIGMDQCPSALLQQKDEKNNSWTLFKNGVWNGSHFPSIY